MIRAIDARFVTTAVEPKGYPKGDLPEFAFVGRSNVGKSSMINVLAARKKLVRVSNTPGRTRTLNFFDVDLLAGRRRLTVRLADLPGYGFAKVSKTERDVWEKMITAYLSKRIPLRGVVAIVDAEVGPTPEDVETVRYLFSVRPPGKAPRLLAVATKLDRLNKARRKPALNHVAQTLSVPREDVLGFSAVDKTGLDELWGALFEATK